MCIADTDLALMINRLVLHGDECQNAWWIMRHSSGSERLSSVYCTFGEAIWLIATTESSIILTFFRRGVSDETDVCIGHSWSLPATERVLELFAQSGAQWR